MLLYYNKKKEHIIITNRPSTSISPSFSIYNKDKNKKKSNNKDKSINLIDILEIDKYSRLTLTKKVKSLLSLKSGDKIIVYQEKGDNNNNNNDKDTNSKRVLIKIQHQNKMVEAAIDCSNPIKRCNNFNSHFDDIDLDATDTVLELYDDDRTNNFIADNKKEQIKKREGNKIMYNHLSQNENTPYQTPIILIDDDTDLLLTFNLLLKNEGYNNLKTFSDSKSLLKHLLDIDNLVYYKLAITDIRMPCINGIQLYQVLKILNPSIKILFVTSLDVANEISNIYSEVKSQDVIRKPVDGNHFVQMVNNKVRTV
jgi:CheY-like chemotaxis protein